jgi:hypothetical protein
VITADAHGRVPLHAMDSHRQYLSGPSMRITGTMFHLWQSAASEPLGATPKATSPIRGRAG